LWRFEDEFKELRKAYHRRKGKNHFVELEAQIAVDDKWGCVDWFDDFAWLRAKIDVLEVNGVFAEVKDHKTGRQRPENVDQLELYAIAIFCKYPFVETVNASFWYLDEGVIDAKNFARHELDSLKKKWLKRIKPMMNDTTFKPKPCYLCKWCKFSKEEGGPCKF